MSGPATGCGARKEAFTFIGEDGKADIVSFRKLGAFGTAQLKNNEDVRGHFEAVGQSNRRYGQQSTIGVAVKKDTSHAECLLSWPGA
jgi:hypothetical protein